MVFRAIAAGRLAGRDWQPGDTIALCDPHAADVYQVIDIVRPSDEPDSAGWLERA
ncbi:hypothetical protein [Rugosimonospora africana]|uniref:Uncharacterized protein n=1 Tax=Rugosimonospora africana TaxID=556532 RepID=A0A8J3VV35_9ACTN|nr:hypothetical protein [Rugosimonospora africana]GIH20217.1 hypothetical protein Raf01_83890 [Rugosimonospora africana]